MDPYMEFRTNEGLYAEFADAMQRFDQTFLCNLHQKEISAFSTNVGMLVFDSHHFDNEAYPYFLGNVSYEVPSSHGSFAILTDPGSPFTQKPLEMQQALPRLTNSP